MAAQPPASVDVVVVGAGTAGAIVAGRLAAAGDRSVLLVERGPGRLPDPSITALTRLPLDDPERSAPVAEIRRRPVVRGRGLGGSAAINGGYFLRPHLVDLDEWPSWWTTERCAAAFTALDGGDVGGGAMSVSSFADDELGDVAAAFEQYWTPRLGPPTRGAWSRPGLVRVRSNRRAGRRFTAADAFLSSPTPGLTVLGETTVAEIVHDGRRAHGVRIGGETVAAGEVILAAGTLGTADLLLRSGVLHALGLPRLPTHEHAERLVRFTPRRSLRAPALLQSVVHTDDGLEIRCYSGDFARFLGGHAERGVPIGVTDMLEPTRGAVDQVGLDLGAPTPESLARMDRGAAQVAQMLAAAEFAELVVPGSIEIDPTIGMSQHATGTLPLGGPDVDHLGSFRALRGLRVVDGSVLPGPVHSGPHATNAMVAWAIAEGLTGQNRVFQ
ncbi:mycofactocin system GMC family oxidoreductase MftG [Gordonia alkaliphila]|uniref:mycofactocin system GMC family oxidoreductase MftG n=1 Tax=Gordonia alkaliphila TaxID=1053547 RepID=UPI001FF3F89A|nr:mycofactocin system GMC family oxidoreductase MftG [Gordonia alkaliphila]MCK0438422.1 mycofactocin system GMC family oxidoreductase MftG [Gordonia alkaliphila]